MKSSETKQDSNPMVTHKGGCHCGKVRWEVDASESVVVAWKCNCSDCSMRGNTHFIVPRTCFRLLSGESDITTYTFGTHTAKHTFCSVCGITSFYFPRSNPDGVALTVACVHPGSLSHVEVRKFDGLNWDDFYSASGIATFSKPT